MRSIETRGDYKYLKGLSETDRLGNVLKVDFSPLKVCSFSCVYCRLGPTTRKILEREEFYPVEEVLGEIRDHIVKTGKPDYVMLTGSGEPTLYSGFGRLAEAAQEAFPDVKLTLYTNGSLLHLKSVREEVSVCDLVMINLNTVDERTFRRINRPHNEFSLERVIKAIRQFSEEYEGALWIDSALVRGMNDSEEALDRLISTVTDIGPDLYKLRIVGNRGGKVAEPLTIKLKQRLKDKCRDLPFEVVYGL